MLLDFLVGLPKFIHLLRTKTCPRFFGAPPAGLPRAVLHCYTVELPCGVTRPDGPPPGVRFRAGGAVTTLPESPFCDLQATSDPAAPAMDCVFTAFR